VSCSLRIAILFISKKAHADFDVNLSKNANESGLALVDRIGSKPTLGFDAATFVHFKPSLRLMGSRRSAEVKVTSWRRSTQ
jgi:hypothetical protein